LVLERLSTGYFERLKEQEKKLEKKGKEKKVRDKWKSRAASAGLRGNG